MDGRRWRAQCRHWRRSDDAHRTARYTQDIDLVIWTTFGQWPALVERAGAFGITPRRSDILEFAERTRVLLLQHATGVPVDVSCGVLTFEERVTRDATTVRVGPLQVAGHT